MDNTRAEAGAGNMGRGGARAGVAGKQPGEAAADRLQSDERQWHLRWLPG